MHMHLLVLAAANPWESPLVAPGPELSPRVPEAHMPLLRTGDSPGRREGLSSEQLRSRRSKFLSLSFLEQGGRREPGKVCATGVCLVNLPAGVAVYSSLLLCGRTRCRILPLKGCKLTFSSGNIPFRKKQGKLRQYSNTCEPPGLSLYGIMCLA